MDTSNSWSFWGRITKSYTTEQTLFLTNLWMSSQDWVGMDIFQCRTSIRMTLCDCMIIAVIWATLWLEQQLSSLHEDNISLPDFFSYTMCLRKSIFADFMLKIASHPTFLHLGLFHSLAFIHLFLQIKNVSFQHSFSEIPVPSTLDGPPAEPIIQLLHLVTRLSCRAQLVFSLDWAYFF